MIHKHERAASIPWLLIYYLSIFRILGLFSSSVGRDILCQVSLLSQYAGNFHSYQSFGLQ